LLKAEVVVAPAGAETSTASSVVAVEELSFKKNEKGFPEFLFFTKGSGSA
jgi:hypothetical protein